MLLDETMGNRLWDIRISLNDGPAVHLNDAPEIDAMNKMRSDKTFQAAILPTVFETVFKFLIEGGARAKRLGGCLIKYFAACGVPELREIGTMDEDEVNILVKRAVYPVRSTN